MENFIEANKELWKHWTKGHEHSEMYDLEGFLAGRNSLKAIEIETLGDLSGKSLLHLQCHFGQDTLSLARMGAKACGIDFSPEALQLARRLNTQLGLDVRFFQSNVLEAKGLIDEQFDIVFTSYGVLTWLPDLKPWAEVVSHYLKPGGIFCIVEFHPLLLAFDWDANKFIYPYFNKPEPDLTIATGSYAVEDLDIKLEEYNWSHSLSETIGPLLKNGLELLEFEEYPFSPYNCFPNMRERKDGNFEHKELGNMPHTFMLKMRKA